MWSFLILLPLLGSVCGGVIKHKLLPTSITRSFVNLGKMDIAFYIDSKDLINRKSQIPYQSPITYYEKLEPESPCRCTSLGNLNEPSLNPADILDKILSSNDLFRTSEENPSCCNSHEGQEFIIDVTKPRAQNLHQKPSSILTLPLSFEGFVQPQMPKQPLKDFEFFFFPQTIAPKNGKNMQPANKDSIKFVGDKITKGFTSTFTVATDKANPSVKKDLKSENTEIDAEAAEAKTGNVGETNAL